MNGISGMLAVGGEAGWALAEQLRDLPAGERLEQLVGAHGLERVAEVEVQEGRVLLKVPVAVLAAEEYEVLRAGLERVEDLAVALLGAEIRVVAPSWSRGQRWSAAAALAPGVSGELITVGDVPGERMLEVQRTRLRCGLALLGPGAARRFLWPRRRR